jgi:hypothetical protein
LLNFFHGVYHPGETYFLEVPIYSLKNWNEHCKHKDPSTFKDQDKQLQVQIITLNKEIRKLNLDLNTLFCELNEINLLLSFDVRLQVPSQT